MFWNGSTMSLYFGAAENVRAGQRSCEMKGIVCPPGFLLSPLEKWQVGTRGLKALWWQHVIEVQTEESRRKLFYLDRNNLKAAVDEEN